MKTIILTPKEVTLIPVEAEVISPHHFAGKTIDQVKRKYRIHGNYLISIGIVPRKNTDRIIKAYEKVRAGETIIGRLKIE